MKWIDWLIVLLPLLLVFYSAFYSRRYVRDVTDFLSAGRVCGRYVICVADVANGLAIITLVAFVEIQYKVGFAMTFWNNITVPLGMVMALTGYCFYRFRETRAMSLGQFLEMRYNRSFRIFAAALRSLSEMLANMICPAIAARFFICFFDWPRTIDCFGVAIPTFVLVVLTVLTLAIWIICLGGTLALVITDTIQGLLCYPMLVVFTVFVLVTFSWSNEIVPVMGDRIAGESFLNPFDVEALRDFNVFALIVTMLALFINRASWIGAGNTTAAKTPHEQKMATLLGSWRTGFSSVFYVLIAIAILTLFNHRNFAEQARDIKSSLAGKIIGELIRPPELKRTIIADFAAIPPQRHQISVDAPLSQARNLDTVYLETAYAGLQKSENGNAEFQEFRTLYHQMMLPEAMRKILPSGLLGLFCLLMIMMMVSTDDSRIFSASLTLTQDVIMPLRKKPLSPRQHIGLLRIVSIGVGIFFLIGSFFMAQLDYINLFITIMCSMWLGGAGPVMIFGLYSRFGTTTGAFASLLTGAGISLGGVMIQRNWADYVYPLLERNGWVERIAMVFETATAPFSPYILWEMNPIKAPINSMEIYFIAMIFSMAAYIIGSWLTSKQPFNLDRMLHRGKYNFEGTVSDKTALSWRTIFGKTLGITPEYSTGDKVIAWSIFLYSFVYQFLLTFVLVIIWNAWSRWPIEYWGMYFLIVTLIIPGIVATISTVWFSIGGTLDLFRLFRDLKTRVSNPLDDGRVEGNISIAEKTRLDKIDADSAKM